MYMMKTKTTTTAITKDMDLDAFVDAFFADIEGAATTAPSKAKTKVGAKATAKDTLVKETVVAPVETATKKKFRLPNGQYIEGYSATWGGNGELLEVDGVKMTLTEEERKKNRRKGSRKGGSPRNDEGRAFVTAFALEALSTTLAKAKLAYTSDFAHTKEGRVYRCDEADYGVRVSRSKEAKFDISEEDFEAEISYVTRGKAKHAGGTIARLLVTAADKTSGGVVVAEAKASGVVVHFAGAEYTIKISKKRDRVGFEAERADAF